MKRFISGLSSKAIRPSYLVARIALFSFTERIAHFSKYQKRAGLQNLNPYPLKRYYPNLKHFFDGSVKIREQIKDYLATLVHEVNTPLNNALGFNNFLLDGKVGELSPQQKDLLNSISISLRQIKILMEDVAELTNLDFEREIKPEFEQFDLKKLVRDTLLQFVLMAETAEVGLRYVNLEGSECLILGVRHWITQCVSNLMVNAIKFSPRGECVEVCIESVAKECWITVKDRGPGISLEDQSLIFNRYFQVKSSNGNKSFKSGFGLGLYITKELVERQGGTIKVESQIGVGTCFKIGFPLLQVTTNT